MTTLIDHLRALLGGNSLATEIALLTAADARASRLPREHGVLYSDGVHDAIDELTHPGPCSRTRRDPHTTWVSRSDGERPSGCDRAVRRHTAIAARFRRIET